MKNQLVTTSSFIGDIPVLASYIDDHSKKDLVILSHWFSGNKEAWAGKMEQLANMGYYAVALDNRYHGARKGLSFKEKIFTSEGSLDLLVLRQVMNETAADISILIDHYSAVSIVDVSNTGIIGISMGGFITYASLVLDKRIAWAIPIISSPCWDDIPDDSDVLNSEDAIREFRDYVEENNPANQLDKIYPRKLFGLIGIRDKHFKPERVADFYEKLKTYYPAENKNIKLNQYNIGHEVNDEMWDDVINWLKDNIQ